MRRHLQYRSENPMVLVRGLLLLPWMGKAVQVMCCLCWLPSSVGNRGSYFGLIGLLGILKPHRVLSCGGFSGLIYNTQSVLAPSIAIY